MDSLLNPMNIMKKSAIRTWFYFQRYFNIICQVKFPKKNTPLFRTFYIDNFPHAYICTFMHIYNIKNNTQINVVIIGKTFSLDIIDFYKRIIESKVKITFGPNKGTTPLII